MATDLQQQVDGLLSDLIAVVTDLDTTDGQLDTDELNEIADRADELVSTTELSALMAATGLSDQDEPAASLPAAVASGDPQNVAKLRALLTASKLSTADDDREQLVDELQSLAETVRGEPPSEAETTSDTTEDVAETTSDTTEDVAETTSETTEDVAETTSNAIKDVTETASDATPDEAETTDTEDEEDEDQEDQESTSPIRDLLQSQLEETHGIFDQIPDAEELTAGFGEGGADESASEATDDEQWEDEQSTRSRDGTRWRPGGGKQRTTHSTVPGAGRRDIGRRPGQFSSVRGSTVSKR